MVRLVRVTAGIAAVMYPLWVYWGMGRWDRRWVAAVLVAVAAVRWWQSRQVVWGVVLLGALGVAALTMGMHSWLPLQLYPIIVNAVLLAAFGMSLWRPPSVVERLARLQHPDLSTQGVRYTRRITLVWCVFFGVNGAMSWATCLWATPEVWALYNGLVAYLLMGMLFAGEYLVRQRVLGGRLHG